MMTDKLCQFVEQRRLISPGDTVTCAVSGGADSMALLWALYRAQNRLGIQLACAHYHHGLREAAKEDEAFVRSFCAKHAIPFTCGHGDVAAQRLPGESIELAARRLRYGFLLEAAGDGLLATAHTADDHLETLLLRLTRGASLRGMGGIPVKQGNLIRPLLFATRAQVLAFLAEEGISFREDESNQTDFCPRNRIRHHVIPYLREENPQVAVASVSFSETMREEDAYLSQLAAEALEAAREGASYRCEALRAMPPVLRRRALFAILQEAGVPSPTQRHLSQLTALLETDHPSARASFPGTITLERHYESLCIAQAPKEIPVTPLQIPGVTPLPQAGLKILCSEPKKFEKVENSPFTFHLRCDMIGIGGLFVRSRQSGDQLVLSGGSRSLKRLLIDKKIPASRRGLVPVLADAQGIFAVGGIGADLRCLAKPHELALKIQIEKEEASHEW